MFGASENTIGYASQYMNIYAIGTVFVQLTLGMNAFITAQGYAKVSMYTVLIGAICNIILDPIMIFGMNMGVRGAALATIISQGISCVWVIHFLTSPKSSIKLRMKNIRFDNVLLSCVALGAAPFIMQASESIISICFNSSLLKYGGDIAVGAMTILSTVMQFAMLPMQGFAQGAQPISSYNFGAHNSARVKQTFRLLLIWAYVTYILMMTVYTGINVPYGSMLGVLTNDSDEKTVFSSFRMFFAYAGSFIALFAWEPLCDLFKAHGCAETGAWQGAMIVIAIFCFFLFLLCFRITKEHIKVEATSLSSDVSSLLRNSPWLP
jgi:Na+-driven multidrug efflux pump